MTRATRRAPSRVLALSGRPAPVGDLLARTWRTLVDADRPLTAPQLADLAGLTRGGAYVFLKLWANAGHLEAVNPTAAPYLVTYRRTRVEELGRSA